MAFCSNCGKEVSEGVRFCPACGTEIKAPVAAAAPVAPPVVNNVNTEAFTAPVPEKKNKKTALIVVAAVVVIGIVAAIANYFTGDGYRFNKAMDMLRNGQYEEAYEILDSLGDYKDAAEYLPFNGKYINLSVGDERTYTFHANGEYTQVIPSSDGDSTYEGTFELDGYEKATLTDDDGDLDAIFSIYKNYIYESEDEDFIFDEEIDASEGYFNAETKEISEINLTLSSGVITAHFTWEFTFEDDGTYKLRQRFYEKDINKPYSDTVETGTYEFEDNVLTVTPNEEDEDVKTYLIIDGKMYRSVYVREYDVD